jgi:hypothetical protein
LVAVGSSDLPFRVPGHDAGCPRWNANPPLKAALRSSSGAACRPHHLIANGNRIWPGGRGRDNDGRAWLRAGRKRHDHNRPPRPVEGVGGDHDRRPGFSDLASLSGIQIDPPDFASARRCGICWPGSRHRERFRLASDAKPSSMVAVSHSAISAANVSSCSTASAAR